VLKNSAHSLTSCYAKSHANRCILSLNQQFSFT
jgi:hypothetical protein